jgi:hypothetical protein
MNVPLGGIEPAFWYIHAARTACATEYPAPLIARMSLGPG